MIRYQHLTLNDRECLLVGLTLKQSYQAIAQRIGCSKATISQEISRNGGRSEYSAVNAQLNYERQRLNSRRPRSLSQTDIRALIINCIVHRKWSPEQIEVKRAISRNGVVVLTMWLQSMNAHFQLKIELGLVTGKVTQWVVKPNVQRW